MRICEQVEGRKAEGAKTEFVIVINNMRFPHSLSLTACAIDPMLGVTMEKIPGYEVTAGVSNNYTCSCNVLQEMHLV
jgi:hypothetical protein